MWHESRGEFASRPRGKVLQEASTFDCILFQKARRRIPLQAKLKRHEQNTLSPVSSLQRIDGGPSSGLQGLYDHGWVGGFPEQFVQGQKCPLCKAAPRCQGIYLALESAHLNGKIIQIEELLWKCFTVRYGAVAKVDTCGLLDSVLRRRETMRQEA